jgi:Transglycosylase SLT domain
VSERARNLALASILLAGLTPVQPVDAESLSCTQAAAAVEVGAAIPTGLLLAIGNVESGRTDPMGARAPWPWTINAGGVGHFFASSEDAVFAVQALRAGGVQSIDIGCFQINLFHHPDAFPDLASGFDPLINAKAAARFLVSLHEELGTWELTIAAYHSRADTLGAPYRDHVLASWHGTAFAGRSEFPGIHIWGPAGEIGFDAALPSLAPRISVAASSRARMPRVITISVR